MELPLTKLPFLPVNSYLNLCRLPWAPPFLSRLLSFWMPTSPVETSPSICTVVIYVYISSVERKVKVKSLSRVRLFATPWTVAYQAPLSMRFSRQEYWSGLPFPSPKSKCLLIWWLQSLSAVILESKKIKSATVSTASPSICHEVIR